jgi:hypothetical protein
MLLGATIVAVLLAGCGGTPQDGRGSQNGSFLGDSSNSQEGSNLQGRSEAANANSVDRCAGNVSTRRQQEGRGEDSNDTQIAFTRVIAGEPTASGPYATESELYVMNADGTNETRLTNTPESYARILATSPDWSPDGKRIAYLKGIDVDTGRTDRDIYVINADGSNPSSLTTVEQSTIAWSPDGQKIAFKSASSGNDDIYVINADGSGRTNLTNTKRSEDYVIWSPARVGTITERTQEAIENREAIDSGPQDEELQAYIKQINKLRERNLRGSEEGSEVRQLAYNETQQVLGGSDPSTKEKAVRFLARAGLLPSIPINFTDLRGTDLSGVNLSGANMSSVNLSGVKLSNANLSKALTVDCNFRGADLSNANLSNAGLQGDDFRNADLSGADLSGADLAMAELTEDQLAQAESLAGVRMPSGTQRP